MDEIEAVASVLWRYLNLKACFEDGEPPPIMRLEDELKRGNRFVCDVQVEPEAYPVIVSDASGWRFLDYIWRGYPIDPARVNDSAWASRAAKFLQDWTRTGPVGGDSEWRFHAKRFQAAAAE